MIGTIIGTLGSAAAQYMGGRAAAETLAIDPQDIRNQFEDLRASMPQYGVGSAWNEYLAQSKMDPAAARERQAAREQEATSTGALKSGGARAILGGLNAVQAQGSKKTAGIETRSQERKMGALGKYAGIQQGVNTYNTQQDQNLKTSEFEALSNADRYNAELQAAAEQAQWDAISSTFGAFGSLGGKTDLSTSFPGGSSFGAGAFGGGGGTLQNGYGGLTELQKLQMGWNESGGMITPGEFSHETNPIDMIKDGVKIGELTGREAVLNELQQEEVAKQSPIFRELMREFAKKAAMKAKK